MQCWRRRIAAAGLDGGIRWSISASRTACRPGFRALLFAWLQKFHVRPPAHLADAVVGIGMDLEAPFSFVDLSRGYACYAEIRRPA
jgi:hypothetical protein